MTAQTPSDLRLHAIIDPYCGWCYAAAPLLDIAQSMPHVELTLHGGGMLTGTNVVHVSPQFRAYVMQHDQRIAKITGQPFGDAYYNGLLHDSEAVLNSMQPTTAMLAAQALGGYGLDMLHREQKALYVEGLHISKEHVLTQLAQDIGLNAQQFTAAYQQLAGNETQDHIEQSRALLLKVGGQGFPTLALETPDADWAVVDLGSFLGRPQEWKKHLQTLLHEQGHDIIELDETSPAQTACPIDGCALPRTTN